MLLGEVEKAAGLRICATMRAQPAMSGSQLIAPQVTNTTVERARLSDGGGRVVEIRLDEAGAIGKAEFVGQGPRRA